MNLTKKIVLSGLLALILLARASHGSWARAQNVKNEEASGSAKPTPATASPETTQKLRERIEKIVDEKSDQVRGTIDDLSQQKRGFIGEVQRVSQEAITVKSRKGTQILPITSDTQLFKAGKAIEVGSIAVGDWVVVIGVVENDTFTPRRILVSGKSLRPRDHLVTLGAITELTTKELNLLTRQGEQLTLTINTKTKYQDQEGNKVSVKNFSPDMQVLVVGYHDGDNKIATTVRAIAALEPSEEE